MENVSLFRVEESEVEQELRAMLGLATPEDPEPAASAQSPPQASPGGPESPAQGVEPTPSSLLVPDPAQSLSDMQVDQMKVLPVTTLPPDQTPVKEDPPLSNQTPSTIKFNERPPPVSEPLQPPSWNPIGFVGDEDEEEEEEIPSINMDSDSD